MELWNFFKLPKGGSVSGLPSTSILSIVATGIAVLVSLIVVFVVVTLRLSRRRLTVATDHRRLPRHSTAKTRLSPRRLFEALRSKNRSTNPGSERLTERKWKPIEMPGVATVKFESTLLFIHVAHLNEEERINGYFLILFVSF